MRIYSCLLFVILLISGCNAPIRVQTSVPQKSPSFQSTQLARDGLAVLPTTSNEYQNVINENTKRYFNEYVGDTYLNPNTTAKILNETNTLSIYRDVIDTYQKTGVGDTKKLRKIGSALGKRYLIKVDFGKLTSKQETKTILDDVNSYETRETSVMAIVFDCSNGDIVWQATAKAKADENGFGTIRQANNEFIQKSVVGLMKELFRNQIPYQD